MISIFVPLYNKRKSIARCIDSILAQTYQDWELIIINDGSTDGSEEIVFSYLTSDKIHYYYQENRGVSSARNQGIQRASGDWVLYIDADDYLLPDALEVLVTMSHKYSVDIVSGNYYSERNGIRTKVLHRVTEGVVKDNFHALFRGCFDIRAGATLYRASLLKQYSFDETLCRYEDAKFEFDLLRTHQVAITPHMVMVYSNDYNGLSKPCDDFKKDYLSQLSFKQKPFWEKVFLGRLLCEAMQTYPEQKRQIRLRYGIHLIWMKVSKILS